MIRRMTTRAIAALRRFGRREDAALSVEAALTWPLLIGACALMLVLWDGFRTRTMTLKANYVVADLVSRQSSAVTQGMIDDYNALFRLISGSRHDTAIRVSVVRAALTDENDPDSEMVYSLTDSAQSGGIAVATNYEQIADQGGVPPMVHGESLIIVDVFRFWVPIRTFTNLMPQLITERSATRPRFTTTIDLP